MGPYEYADPEPARGKTTVARGKKAMVDKRGYFRCFGGTDTRGSIVWKWCLINNTFIITHFAWTYFIAVI
jgi:hypothetical protein